MRASLPIWLTRVRSHSMEPTLHDGQLVWTRALRRTDRLQRGDLVVVDSAELGRRIVKRVIGLPTEHLAIRAGTVSVNGVDLHEPYASASFFNGTFTVPDDSYLLLGDNRDASHDSRSWREPYVRRDQIAGRLRPPLR